MKKSIFGTLFLLGISITTLGQTNRINHYSHSGNDATLHIFKSSDNMGCGEVLKHEYEPDTIKKAKKKEVIDSTKIKNAILIPKAIPPRKGLSLETQYDVKSILNKF